VEVIFRIGLLRLVLNTREKWIPEKSDPSLLLPSQSPARL
jgi:hypothetical protein